MRDEVEMKDPETAKDASGWDGSPATKLTPIEVQQKEFRVARFGAGYRMREVDEFLDHVTDTLTALIAENERLRTAGPRSSAAPAVASPTSDGDRAAVDAFLRTEKGFLRDLGTLVQSHADELKTMVRSARSEDPATPAGAGAVAAAETETDRPPADVEAASPPGAAETAPKDEEEQEQEEPAAEPIAPAQEEGTVAVAEPPDGGEDTMTGVIAEEPIRLEQPEPARSGRSDDERDGSLRELFWGEE